MNWKLKAAVQRAVARLPVSVSYPVHYWLQRRFGAYRRFNPTLGLQAARLTWQHILSVGHDPRGKTFFEIGTGRVPVVPLALWLMGAKQTISIDINPYLRVELLQDTLRFFRSQQSDVIRLLEPHLDAQRFNALLERRDGAEFSLENFLATTGISYIAPANAALTAIPDSAVDYHTSYHVFEHIPAKQLSDILAEGNRILAPGGLFVHCVDYSDHFSHTDKSISRLNFLQYSDQQWRRIAENRYSFTNRLRHDDVLDLLAQANHTILSESTTRNERALSLVRSGGIRLDPRFAMKSPMILAVTEAWIISHLRHPEQRRSSMRPRTQRA